MSKPNMLKLLILIDSNLECRATIVSLYKKTDKQSKQIDKPMIQFEKSDHQ